MSGLKKKLLALATIWPFGYMFLFIGFIFLMILLSSGGGEMGVLPGAMFVLLMVVHFLTIFLILGLQIYYIIHAIKNELLTQNSKIAWIVAFFFGGFIAMPIYWYLSIWKTPELETSGYPTLQSGSDLNPAYSNEPEFKTADPVPREPHSWR